MPVFLVREGSQGQQNLQVLSRNRITGRGISVSYRLSSEHSMDDGDELDSASRSEQGHSDMRIKQRNSCQRRGEKEHNAGDQAEAAQTGESSSQKAGDKPKSRLHKPKRQDHVKCSLTMMWATKTRRSPAEAKAAKAIRQRAANTARPILKPVRSKYARRLVKYV